MEHYRATVFDCQCKKEVLGEIHKIQPFVAAYTYSFSKTTKGVFTCKERGTLQTRHKLWYTARLSVLKPQHRYINELAKYMFFFLIEKEGVIRLSIRQLFKMCKLQSSTCCLRFMPSIAGIYPHYTTSRRRSTIKYVVWINMFASTKPSPNLGHKNQLHVQMPVIVLYSYACIKPVTNSPLVVDKVMFYNYSFRFFS